MRVGKSGGVLAAAVLSLFLIPILTFYMLRDWDTFMLHLGALVPDSQRETVFELARETDSVLGAFLRGQVLVMLALAAIYTLGLSLVGRPKGGPFPKGRLALIAALTAAVLVLAWKAPDLPLDNLATRLKPGVEVSEICAGSDENPEQLCLDALVSDLTLGRHWVVLSDLQEPAFLEAVPRLNEGSTSQSEVGVWVLTAASTETVSTFQWTQAPAFVVQEVPYAMLRPLFRRLPRSFLVEDGEVIETVSDLPPEAF